MRKQMSKIEELEDASRELSVHLALLQHCLKLGLLYYDQGSTKRGDYYLNLSDEYYRDIKEYIPRAVEIFRAKGSRIPALDR
jgi:hypothetical protein